MPSLHDPCVYANPLHLGITVKNKKGKNPKEIACSQDIADTLGKYPAPPKGITSQCFSDFMIPSYNCVQILCPTTQRFNSYINCLNFLRHFVLN